jgi:hypothetical protein
MFTHIREKEQVSASGLPYQVAFCGISDLLTPNGVLIMDIKTVNSTLRRFLCEKCLKVRSIRTKNEQD